METNEKTTYWLAEDHGTEGWSLHDHESLQAIADYIQDGNVYGRFKVFKELNLGIWEKKTPN